MLIWQIIELKNIRIENKSDHNGIVDNDRNIVNCAGSKTLQPRTFRSRIGTIYIYASMSFTNRGRAIFPNL